MHLVSKLFLGRVSTHTFAIVLPQNILMFSHPFKLSIRLHLTSDLDALYVSQKSYGGRMCPRPCAIDCDSKDSTHCLNWEPPMALSLRKALNCSSPCRFAFRSQLRTFIKHVSQTHCFLALGAVVHTQQRVGSCKSPASTWRATEG